MLLSFSTCLPASCGLEIATRFIVGINVGIPAALLVISHRLFKIASRTATFSTRAEKRRALIIDLAIGLGIPLVQMPLQLVVEGHRFDILEEIGCYPAVFNVTLAFPLVYTWPFVISVISAIYSELLKEMPGSNKSLNHSRYMRLIALSSTQLLVNLPVSLYNIFDNAQDLSPWISWENTHSDYSFVGQLPSAAWRLHKNAVFEMDRWLVVFSAFSFFAFFGFAEEARKHYSLAFSFASSRLHLGKFGTRSTSSSLRSPNTSFGPGIKKGMATLLSFKDGFSPWGAAEDPYRRRKAKHHLPCPSTG
ncbi:pheromone A receptor-domain-containing protein [Lactarius quietus]|nr:pheromone A receptor-domain-containing protein [Lactarius quietus]